MPKVDLATARLKLGSAYSGALAETSRDVRRTKLHEQAGLTQFGANLLLLPPGQWSSQRHWHHANDEFVWVLEGEVVLVTDAGETVLRAGEGVGFAAGVADGHHFQNRSGRDARLLEAGSRKPQDAIDYPDIDAFADARGLFHRDGRPFGTN